MLRLHLSSILFSVLILSTAFSQDMIKGCILNEHDEPVSGAVVRLQSRPVEAISGYYGKFSLDITGVLKGPMSSVNSRKLQYKNGYVIMDNPEHQKVTITLYNLHGKMIARLHNGILGTGQHQFRMPLFSKKQIIIVHAQANSFGEEFFRLAGPVTGRTYSHIKSAENKVSESRTVFSDQILVSHHLYDEATVPVTDSEDSLTIRLHRKLSPYYLNTLQVGDTASFAQKGISLSLDSINDRRCYCDTTCEQKGDISVYLTFRVNGSVYPLIFSTGNSEELLIEGYTICPLPIDTCIGKYQGTFTFDVAVYPTGYTGLLFIEHSIKQKLTSLSETCGMFDGMCMAYSVNGSTGGLAIKHTVEFGNSVIVLFGNEEILSGDIGIIGSSTLSAVAPLPFAADSNLVITGIEANGTVQVRYKNEILILSPGESTSSDTVFNGNYSFCEYRFEVNDLLTNYGFLLPYQIRQNFRKWICM